MKHAVGVLCYFNSRCGNPANVGKVVTITANTGMLDGEQTWEVSCESGIEAYLEEFLRMGYRVPVSSKRCVCCQQILTPISGDDLVTEKERETELLS